MSISNDRVYYCISGMELENFIGFLNEAK